MKKTIILCFFIALLFSCKARNENIIEQAANNVLVRTIGANEASKFQFVYTVSEGYDSFSIQVKNNKVYVSGSSPTALCRGAYDYLRNECHSIISWSGNRINIPEQLPQVCK